jgi:antitoxin CptB
VSDNATICPANAAADIAASNPYITLARHARALGIHRRAEYMAEAAASDEAMNARRRRLRFRAWHRGMREMDLILGRFADSAIERLSLTEIEQFEALLQLPDREVLAWITGEADVDANFDTALFRRLRDFNRRGEGAQ